MKNTCWKSEISGLAALKDAGKLGADDRVGHLYPPTERAASSRASSASGNQRRPPTRTSACKAPNYQRQTTSGRRVKHVECRLWEVRLKGRSGVSRALYVTAVGRRVVIVRVFVKNTEKAPRREIDLALSRAKSIR